MDDAMKGDVLEELGKERNITFTPQDIKTFKHAAFIGVPFSQLKSIYQLDS